MKNNLIISMVWGVFFYLDISLIIVIIRQIIELGLKYFTDMGNTSSLIMVFAAVFYNLIIIFALRYYLLGENLKLIYHLRNFWILILSFFLFSIVKSGLEMLKPLVINESNNILLRDDITNQILANQVVDIMNRFTIIVSLIVIGYILLKKKNLDTDSL